MGYLTSGNQIVDAMGSLNITGNIIPTIWYRTILRENGKPYLLAIAILADIVYWYRPVEVRDPATMLQKSLTTTGRDQAGKRSSPGTSCGRATSIMRIYSGNRRRL